MCDDPFYVWCDKIVRSSQLFMFKPVFNWVCIYHKNYQHIETSTCWVMKFLEDFHMGYENLKLKLDGL